MNENKPSQDEAQEKKAPSPAVNYLLLSAGSIFTSMLISGFLVGYFLDELFGTRPIFMLACGVLGFIGGIQKVHKLSSRLDPASPKKQEDDGK